jgi:transposase-like protein
MPRRMRRKYTAGFKGEVVRDLLTGTHSAAELCREHQLSPSLLSLWKESALEHLEVLFQAQEERDPQQARIADLEQLLGRQTLELEILKKASRLLSGNQGRNGRSS